MKKVSIGLVGNPNCGKTTIFNALTGSHQRVGNWPGVTVERKSGSFFFQNQTMDVIDLPGTYSLTTVSENASVDESIACHFIFHREADLIINIIDANHLERHLYLTLQLREMHVPMIIALNMMDTAPPIDCKKLEKMLQCPIIPLEAHRDKGIKELKHAIVNARKNGLPEKIISYPDDIEIAIQKIAAEIPGDQSSWFALRLLENDIFIKPFVTEEVLTTVKKYQEIIQKNKEEESDIMIADARYRCIENIVSRCVTPSTKKMNWTASIDKMVLNRILGIPIFLSVMYFLFFFSINIGGAFQDFFDIGSNTIFVQGLQYVLNVFSVPSWLTAILANGVGKGINTMITFIPVIGAMFLCLAFLEESGYMARAAFVVDRGMQSLGLPGKSFVPMIVGFGCNVPAVMAARTLENKRDRILTVMMSPFMSCGARLAIYAVFTAAFFPHGGQNIVFLLYLIGIMAAVLTGLALRKTVLKGDPAPLVMELPPYHIPRLNILCIHAWQRLKNFVFRAGKLIVPICILIGALNGLNIDGSINTSDGSTNSLLSIVGRFITPIFEPMGIHANNWPASVGLLTGILAKEVVVGTLNTLYSQAGHLANLPTEAFHFWGGLHDAIKSIPDNFAQLGDALKNPVLAKAPVHTVTQGVYGIMYQRFDGQVGAMAYLLFVLLYFPCVSTTAVMARELNRRWAIFSVVWTTLVAYAVAVIFYQLMTITHHIFSSTVWVFAMLSVLSFVVLRMRFYSEKRI